LPPSWQEAAEYGDVAFCNKAKLNAAVLKGVGVIDVTGPLLPFSHPRTCRSAARQTGLSLHAQNWGI